MECQPWEIFATALEVLSRDGIVALQAIAHATVDAVGHLPWFALPLAPAIALMWLCSSSVLILVLFMVCAPVLGALHAIVKPVECLYHPLCCNEVQHYTSMAIICALELRVLYLAWRFFARAARKRGEGLQEPLVPVKDII